MTAWSDRRPAVGPYHVAAAGLRVRDHPPRLRYVERANERVDRLAGPSDSHERPGCWIRIPELSGFHFAKIAIIDHRDRSAKRYLNSALLIIDEVGFRPLDRMEANLFFRLVSARYEKGSIIVTTNEHVRIVHIDGRSYRLRELDKLLTLPPTASSHTGGGASGPKPRKPGAWIQVIANCVRMGDP